MKKIFGSLLGLVLIIALIFVFWKFIVLLVQLLQTLDKQVAAAIIAASATVIVSVASLIFAKYYENKRLIEKDIRDKKIIVYEKLMTYFFKLLGSKNKSKVQSMDDFYIEFSPSFLTWGSDEVIKHRSEFRKIASTSDSPAILSNFEKLLLVIRKDVGHKNKGIDKNRILLGAFINDLDSLYGDNTMK